MYKDREKQKEAVRKAVKRYKKKKGITRVLPEEEKVLPGITPEFIEGMGNWAKLRGVKFIKPVLISEEFIPAKDVPNWKKQKNAQMEKFLKGTK